LSRVARDRLILSPGASPRRHPSCPSLVTRCRDLSPSVPESGFILACATFLVELRDCTFPTLRRPKRRFKSRLFFGGTLQTAEFGVRRRFIVRPSFPLLPAPRPRPRCYNHPQSPAPAPRGSPRRSEFAVGISVRVFSCPSRQVAVPLRHPFRALSIPCSGNA
jgi:hypothetical protein